MNPQLNVKVVGLNDSIFDIISDHNSHEAYDECLEKTPP